MQSSVENTAEFINKVSKMNNYKIQVAHFIFICHKFKALEMNCNKEENLAIGENKPMTIEYFSKIMGKSFEKMEEIKICKY